MKTKTIGFLLVGWVFLAIAIAWPLSCKDEAEATEPELTIVIPDAPKSAWKCSSCGQGYGEMLEVFCGCGKKYKTLDLLMKCVPTWPDYIELEKTLVLKYDYPEPNTPPHEISILPRYDAWVFTKGTKIYFKDERVP